MLGRLGYLTEDIEEVRQCIGWCNMIGLCLIYLTLCSCCILNVLWPLVPLIIAIDSPEWPQTRVLLLTGLLRIQVIFYSFILFIYFFFFYEQVTM